MTQLNHPTAADSRANDWTILPPIGEATKPEHWGDVAKVCFGLYRETQEAFALDHQQADTNYTIFRFADDPKPSKKKVTSNQIRDDCLQTANQLLREPPDITIAPVETGAPPIMVPLGQPQMDPATGQPMMDEMGQMMEAMFPIDDQVQAKFWQRQFDFYWARGRLERACAAATINAAVFGWTFVMLEWDTQRRLPKLWTTISNRQVGIDPNVGCVDVVEEANYAWVRWYIDRWKAIAQYPQLQKWIEDRKHIGAPRSDGHTQLGGNVSRNYYRPMVDIKHVWLRNQPAAPMTPEQAIAAGLIEERTTINATNPGDQAGGAAVSPDVEDDGVQGEAAPDSERPVVDAASEGAPMGGALADADPAQLLQPRAANDSGGLGTDAQLPLDQRALTTYVLAGTDTEVTPDSTGWPYWLALRHLVTIDDQIVAIDEVVNGWDIPLAHLVCLPVPNSPIGIGIPEGMSPMQRGKNRMLTNLVDYTDYFPNPGQIIASSMALALREKGADLHVRPGRMYEAPDELVSMPQGPIKTIEPPPLNEGVVEVYNLVTQEMGQRANNSNVDTGKQEGTVDGWQGIQMLLQQAAARHDLEGQWLADMVWRVARLLLHELIYRLSVDELMLVCSEYPPEIVQVFKQIAMEGEWDIDVTVHSAVGTVQARKRAEAVQKRQLGVISQQTLTERMGEDWNEEQQRLGQENAAMMAQQAAQMDMNPAPPGKKESPNGNGQHAGSNGNGRF